MDFFTAENTKRTAKATESLVTGIHNMRRDLNESKHPKWHQWAILVASVVAALASLVSAVK
jgi:hypothetical protein